MDTVLKPIVDGINNWVKGLITEVGNYIIDHDDSHIEEFKKKLFGPFYDVLKIIISVMDAILSIIKPFLELVSDLLQGAIDFIGGIIRGALGGSEDDYDSKIDSLEGDDTKTYLLEKMEVENENSRDSTGEVVLKAFSIVADFVSFAFAVVGLSAGYGGLINVGGAIKGVGLSALALFITLLGANIFRNVLKSNGIDISVSFANFIAASMGFIISLYALWLTIMDPMNDPIIKPLLLLWTGGCTALNFINWLKSASDYFAN